MISPPSHNETGSAFFSLETPIPLYRWSLTRNLGGSRPLVVIGLNPSTADAERNDPTIGREIGFAKLWGYSWLVKVNAYGYRTKSPAVMRKAQKSGVDIVGEHNDQTIVAAIAIAEQSDGRVMVAWGGNIDIERERAIGEVVARNFRDAKLWAFKLNGDGSPSHPLYLKSDIQPVRWYPRTTA